MLLEKYKIQELNDASLKTHRQHYEFVAGSISNRDEIIQKLIDFQVAIPSWALGAGGTRFGASPLVVNLVTWKRKLRMLVCCMPLTNRVEPSLFIFPGIFQKTQTQ